MTYQTVLEKLEISDLSAEERVTAILTMPVEDILSKVPPGLPLFPVIDGKTVPVLPTFSDIVDTSSTTIPGKKWLKGLFIGDSQLDVRLIQYSPVKIQTDYDIVF
jgi:hypothetical protein